MKQYHKNPRQMTARQDADLRRWLREFGDLSGIVHDLNSDEIIGGNQRGRIFDIDQCEIELAEGPHEPDEQGTVAHGYVTWQGARYAYRQVRWTPKQCEQANIIANKAGGTFDFDALANGFEFDDLLDWGFDKWELGGIADPIDYDEAWKGMPEFEQEDLSPVKSIKVNFASIGDIEAFSELIGQTLTEKTRSIWYPKAEERKFMDKRYVE